MTLEQAVQEANELIGPARIEMINPASAELGAFCLRTIPDGFELWHATRMKRIGSVPSAMEAVANLVGCFTYRTLHQQLLTLDQLQRTGHKIQCHADLFQPGRN